MNGDWVIACTKDEDGIDISGTQRSVDVYKRDGFAAIMEACRVSGCIKTVESRGGKAEYKEYTISHPVFGTGKLTTYDLKSGVDGVLIAGTPTAWYEWNTLAITMYA